MNRRLGAEEMMTTITTPPRSLRAARRDGPSAEDNESDER